MKPDIIHSHDFVNDAVALIESGAHEAIAARGTFSLSLSGGNTPKPVYEAFARRPVDWSRVVITFGDERCVPPDDAQSNYLMARRTLLDAVPIPPENVLRMRGEIAPAEAAREYEAGLRARAEGGVFRHDLILLGMGPDGHTASLFPGTPALTERERLVVENYVPKMEMWRVTFTYPLLDAARHVCFLVNSAGKDDVLNEVFGGTSDYPCAAVSPTDGRLTWLLGA
ncbi:MAG: 6-phosphogluconolactonase [Terrimicrobiaceae bacterium]|nr:6-phosphogluconolactonase [Terrimicrobiaceae bacterium]